MSIQPYLADCSAGIAQITYAVSEPFVVYSPKLFKGMSESTALTRHLAGQGYKVKLRTDTSIGRQCVIGFGRLLMTGAIRGNDPPPRLRVGNQQSLNRPLNPPKSPTTVSCLLSTTYQG